MTDPARWKRIKELFVEARSLRASQRAAFLAEACAGDASLREDLDSLLEHAEAAGDFLEGAEVRLEPGSRDSQSANGAPSEEELARARARDLEHGIGPYRPLEVLGEGGMGTVYLAEQIEPLRRFVALKVMRADLDGPRVLSRFEGEWRVLARLSHPNVAHVLDAGVTEDGRPFLAMEYVPGEPLTHHCDRAKLSVRHRLELFRSICQAVHHSHLRGVLHRDLKPSNLLVARVDGRAVPKVIDFGVAKALGEDAVTHPTAAGLTTRGQFIGTPEYASPEQLAGSADIDMRSDVYALGVVLHELLVGSLPGETRDSSRPSETLRVHEVARAEEIARSRSTTRHGLQRAIRRDLDWVVLEALAPDREQRYASAQELGADVARVLRRQPTQAGPQGPVDRGIRFFRRHKAAVFAAVVLGTGIGLGFAGLQRGVVQAQEAEQRALSDADSADRVVEFLLTLFNSAGPRDAPISAVTARSIVNVAATEMQSSFSDEPRTRARLYHALGAVYHRLGEHELALRLTQSSLEAWAQSGSESHGTLASTWQVKASIHRGSAEFAEAEAALDEALRCLPPDEPRSHERINSIRLARADLFEARGLWEEAEALLFEIQGSLAEAGLEESNLAYEVMRELCELYKEMGRFEEAEEACDSYLPHALARGGEYHPFYAYALTNLAELYVRTDRRAEGERLYREILRIRESTLGPDHPAVGETLAALAQSLAKSSKFDEAEPMIRRAIAIAEKTFGTDRVHHPMLLGILGNIKLAGGDGREALGLYDRAIPAVVETVGENHVSTIGFRMNRAGVLMQQGRYSDAYNDLHTLVPNAREVLGEDHPLTLMCRVNYAACMDQIGLKEGAILELGEAIERFGPNDPNRAVAQAQHAGMLLRAGAFDEARARAQAALEFAKTAPPGHAMAERVRLAAQGVLSQLPESPMSAGAKGAGESED